MSVEKGHLLSLLEALLVTFLWSSSYVLIKIGLREIPPLLFAAVRYGLAFGILFLVMLAKQDQGPVANLHPRDWIRLVIAGTAGYAIAQGLQFVGLYYLPATTTTLLLNFTPVFVVLLGISFLRESPTLIQVVGIFLALIGACVYFLNQIRITELPGVLVVLTSGLGWAAYMIMTRFLQREGKIGTLRLTTTTMGSGTAILMVAALASEVTQQITQLGWIIIAWLSLVNTAFAFYLWNHTLRRLRAYELSILQNTMLVQVVLLASIFLGEQLTLNGLVGIGSVLVGVSLTQIYRTKQGAPVTLKRS